MFKKILLSVGVLVLSPTILNAQAKLVEKQIPIKEHCSEVRFVPGEFIIITFDHKKRWDGILPVTFYKYPKQEKVNHVCRLEFGTYLKDKTGELVIYSKLQFLGHPSIHRTERYTVSSFKSKIKYDAKDANKTGFSVSYAKFGEDTVHIHEKSVKVDGKISKVRVYRFSDIKTKEQILKNVSYLSVGKEKPFDILKDK